MEKKRKEKKQRKKKEKRKKEKRKRKKKKNEFEKTNITYHFVPLASPTHAPFVGAAGGTEVGMQGRVHSD